MDRKFVIALSSLAGSMFLVDAHAIGLGEIKLGSMLNEPLQAEIQLVQVKDLTEGELLVNLASAADFAKAGVDREFLLNSLRFRPDLSDPSHPRIVVTTQQPIREPYLNFLVELQWPSGRLLREYTLLMDLPAFADSEDGGVRSLAGSHVPAGRALPDDGGVAEVSTSRAASTDTAEVTPPPAPKATASKPASKSDGVRVRRATREEIAGYRHGAATPAPVADTAAEAESAPPDALEEPAPVPAEQAVPADGAVADVSYGPTSSSDTLWKIAQRVRNGGSVHQNMLAIQRLNPEAFVNGNINQLKRGKVLKLPTQEEVSSIGKTEAVAEVDAQVAAWKGERQPPQQQAVGAQLDATGKTAEVAPAAESTEGQLTLSAPADTAAAQEGTAAGEGGGEVAALQGALNAGMEELDRAQRENRELSTRAQDLDAQIGNAERLLELQGAELAALQAKLAQEQQARAEAAAQAEAQAKAAVEAQTAAEAQARLDAEAKAEAEAQAQAAAVQQPTSPSAEAQSTPVEAPVQQPAAADTAVSAAATADGVVAPSDVTGGAQTPAQVPAAEPAAVATEQQPEPKQAPKKEPVPAPKQPEAAAGGGAGLSPSILGAIGAVILVLLALFGYRKIAARRAEEADVEEETFAAGEREDVVDATVNAVDADEALAEELASLDLEMAGQAEEAPVAEKVEPPSGDVLGEADIYISFGNFDKGEALLAAAIKAEPARSDYRLKLLELYKEADNLQAFDAAYRNLLDLDDDAATARASELRGKISGADSVPFAFGVASAAAAAGIGEEELDLDFDMDLSGAATEAAVEQPVSSATPADEFDISLDFDAIEPAAPVTAESDSDFALDLDFDLEAPASEAQTGKYAAVQENMAPASEALTARHPAVSADDFVEAAVAAPAVEDELVLDLSDVVDEASLAADDLGLDFDLDLDTGTADVAPSPAAPAVEPAPAPVVEEPVVAESVESADNELLEAVTADIGELDEDLDFLSDADEAATKLDLARAYIDMGDKEGARDILAEVLDEGRDEQKREAQALLDSIA